MKYQIDRNAGTGQFATVKSGNGKTNVLVRPAADSKMTLSSNAFSAGKKAANGSLRELDKRR